MHNALSFPAQPAAPHIRRDVLDVVVSVRNIRGYAHEATEELRATRLALVAVLAGELPPPSRQLLARRLESVNRILGGSR